MLKPFATFPYLSGRYGLIDNLTPASSLWSHVIIDNFFTSLTNIYDLYITLLRIAMFLSTTVAPWLTSTPALSTQSLSSRCRWTSRRTLTSLPCSPRIPSRANCRTSPTRPTCQSTSLLKNRPKRYLSKF